MSVQKALFVVAKYGTFKVGLSTIPKPGPGDILIKVMSTALNPVDWANQKYSILIDEYPAILGLDSAGVVEEVGKDVTTFKKGDRVLHQGNLSNPRGTFQQYTTCPADIVSKIPNNISFDEASTIPLCLGTAVIGLYYPLHTGLGAGLTPPWETGGRNKYKGEPILIYGGSSSVGQFAIQLARLSGFSPIIVTASQRNEEYIKSAGATHFIDRNANVPTAVAEIITAPLKFVFVAIMEMTKQVEAWNILAPGGILSLAPSPSEELTALLKKEIESEKKCVMPYGGFERYRDIGSSCASSLTALLASGDIKPNRFELLPDGLVGIVDGLKRLETNQVSAVKLVAHPQETE